MTDFGNHSGRNHRHRSGRRVSARLVDVLDCELADNRERPQQELIALSIAEPDASVETICLSIEDGDRLCRLLQALEPARPSQTKKVTRSSSQVPSFVAESERNVCEFGYSGYLRRLKTKTPAFAQYVEGRLKSLTSSIRRHCPSRAARRSLEQRLVQAVLVLADLARPQE